MSFTPQNPFRDVVMAFYISILEKNLSEQPSDPAEASALTGFSSFPQVLPVKVQIVMTMSFLLHESPSGYETSELTESVRSSSVRSVAPPRTVPTIIDGQLLVPEVGMIVSRPRLNDLLAKSGARFGATLISGRAGTGKSTLAADFASTKGTVAWYSVGSADSSWEVFSSYFFSSVCGRSTRRPKTLVSWRDESVNEVIAAEFLRYCFGKNLRTSPDLIVMDDIHHLFDSIWFPAFFNQLVLSIVPGVALLMTCRSKPPAPLWRMRSKQMLNVIDESSLDFSAAEVQELCKLKRIPREMGAEAFRRSGGRIQKLIESLDELPKQT